MYFKGGKLSYLISSECLLIKGIIHINPIVISTTDIKRMIVNSGYAEGVFVVVDFKAEKISLEATIILLTM